MSTWSEFANTLSDPTEPAESIGIPGLVRIAVGSDANVTLQFHDEASAQHFVGTYRPSIELPTAQPHDETHTSAGPRANESPEPYSPTEMADPDLSKCPSCGGIADNGHDRCFPPTPYECSKCADRR